MSRVQFSSESNSNLPKLDDDHRTNERWMLKKLISILSPPFVIVSGMTVCRQPHTSNKTTGPGRGVLGLATTLLQISPFDGHFPGSLFVYFRPFHSTFAQKYCFLFQRDSNPLPPSERFDLCSVSDHSFRS